MRDFFKAYVPLAVLVLGGFAVAYHYVNPEPPKRIRIAAGVEDGAYTASARRYAQILAREELTLEVVTTVGSLENLQLLRAERGGVDVAFVQGGTAPPEAKNLMALASVFLEPLWVFHRADLRARGFADLKRRRIAVGVEGSGTRMLALQLLEASGVTDPALLLPIGGRDAVNALLGGRVDAAFFVTARPTPMLEALFRASTIRLLSIAQADAYAKRFRFLSKVVLPEGGLDLAANIPPHPVALLAPAASLVARDGLHPALVDELMEAATEVHGPGQLVGDPGEFPSARYLDLPLGPDAARYLKSGPPFLRRHLPVWAATLVQRFIILLIPVVTLLIPVLRFAPVVYRWGVRRRIYRWYKDLQAIEEQAHATPSAQERARILARLEDVEGEVGQLSVPAAYADGLYHLKAHIGLIRQALGAGGEAPALASPGKEPL